MAFYKHTRIKSGNLKLLESKSNGTHITQYLYDKRKYFEHVCDRILKRQARCRSNIFFFLFLFSELICSPTAAWFPIKELTAMCKEKGATVVVDGAHGPGQVALDLEELGANGVDCFVGQKMVQHP